MKEKLLRILVGIIIAVTCPAWLAVIILFLLLGLLWEKLHEDLWYPLNEAIDGVIDWFRAK